MQYFRLVVRILAIILWTLVSYTTILLGKTILTYLKTPRRIWRSFFVKIWARGIAKIIGMRITTKGTPPKQPFLLVSNHLSYVDIILFFTQTHTIFVAKGDLQHWPLFNFLIKVADTIFIDRGRKKDVMRVNALIRRAIQNNEGIIVFPESTSSCGDGVLRFKPSLFEYAAQNRFPVSYASVSYETPEHEPPAFLSVCWWGDMELGPHFFDLMKISKFDATIHFGNGTVLGSDRKTLAQESWRLVSEQFVPINTKQVEDYVDNKFISSQVDEKIASR
ncbi:MAG: 1-acyl-sn-glycerol-3-phosphate acyltransferase [bacterium]